MRIWTALALTAYLAALAIGVFLPDPTPAALDPHASLATWSGSSRTPSAI